MAPDPCLPYVSRVPLSWVDTPGPAAHWLDGTLLFVDVAGFTALSERLAKQGRAGAEELTDLLGGAFARLLAAAYEDGGSLLSFGGDALLLFFTGNDHERRAAHAAAVIKHKPAELGALETSVGAVRLKLSMGAHSGSFCFLSVGEDSRVVLLLGDDASATVRLEQRATAGQVLLGPSLARAVPEAAGEILDGAALLTRTPRTPALHVPTAGEIRTPPERFLAPALREHIGGQSASEHRRVAVGFLQLRGTDELLRRDPIGCLEAVQDVVVTAQRAAAEYGVCVLGSDIDADGAKLILVGGAPRATEHEEERLLRACRAVLDHDSPLSLRAGVNAGHVFVGDVGPPYRRAFTVMGERVNLAARLMGSAEPGELRTTPKVLAASGTRFSSRTLRPLQLKGIKEPVAAVSVGAPLDRVVDESTELFGRDDELTTLRVALGRAGDGTGGSVEVVGEAGSGKSALLAALIADGTCPSLRVAAAPYESQTPFGLVKRVLRSLLGVDAEADARETGRRASTLLSGLGATDLALVLVAADGELDGDGPAAGPPLQDDLFLQRLSRAIRRTLDVLVPGPSLLVVEDLQWADASSLALLRSIAERLRDTPWLLCASRRPAGAGAGRAMLGRGEVLWLAPLSPEAATELAHAHAPTPMTPQRTAALVARSGGNALFLCELVRSQADLDALPDSVEAVVQARLDALPVYLRTLLRQASVLGALFDLDLLAELAGFLPDRSEWKVLDGLLERTGSRGHFPSQMYCEVAYSALLYRDRRDLHRKAGRALAARSSKDVELLALHAAKAQDDELTWRYAGRAGVRAEARGAHEAAITAFSNALTAHARGRLGSSAQTTPVLQSLGDALVRAGRPAEAVSAYRRGRKVSPLGPYGDPSLLYGEAKARFERGQFAAVHRWIDKGLRASEEREVSLLLLALRASTQLRQGRFTAAERTCFSIIDLTEGTSSLRANAHARDLLHLVLTSVGDPRRAEHRTRALEIYEQLGDLHGQAYVLNNLGMDAYYDGRWVDAVGLFERSRAAEEQDANDVGAAISDMNAAEVLADQGSFDEAHTRLTNAMRTFLASDFTTGTATVFNYLGRLETRRGRYDDAAKHLDAAHDAVKEMGAESLLPDVLIRQAELAVSCGQGTRANEVLDLLDTMPDVGAEMRVMTLRFRAALAAREGRDDEAEQLLRASVAAGQVGSFSEALARHSLGVVLERRSDPEAETHRFAALETLRRLGVHRFRDPLASDELVVIALPPAVVSLTGRRQERAAV